MKKVEEFVVVMDEDFTSLPKSCVEMYRKMNKDERWIAERNARKAALNADKAIKDNEAAKAAIAYEQDLARFKAMNPKEPHYKELYFFTVVKGYAKSTIGVKMAKVRKEAKEKFAKLSARKAFTHFIPTPQKSFDDVWEFAI